MIGLPKIDKFLSHYSFKRTMKKKKMEIRLFKPSKFCSDLHKTQENLLTQGINVVFLLVLFVRLKDSEDH